MPQTGPTWEEHREVVGRLNSHELLFEDQADVNHAAEEVIVGHEARLLALEGEDPPPPSVAWFPEPPSKDGYTVFTRPPDDLTGLEHEAYAEGMSIQIEDPGPTRIWLGELNDLDNPRRILVKYSMAGEPTYEQIEFQLVGGVIDIFEIPEPANLLTLSVISDLDQNVPLFGVEVDDTARGAVIMVIGSTVLPIDPPPDPDEHVAPPPPTEPASFTEIRVGDDVFARVREAGPRAAIKIHPGRYVGQWFEPREGQTIWMQGTEWDGVGTRQWIVRPPEGAKNVSLVGPARAFGYAQTQPRKWQTGILDFRSRWDWLPDEGRHSRWALWDLEVSDSNGVGIYLGGESMVTRCSAHRMSNLGFGGSGSDRTTMWDCEANENTTHGEDGWEAGGSKITVCDGLKVYNWKAARNSGPGWWADISVTDLLMDGFEMVDNIRGIHDEIGYDSTYLNGLLRDNGTPRTWLWGSQLLVSTSQGLVAENITIEGKHDAIGLINQPFRIPERNHPSVEPNRDPRIYETRDVLLREITLRPTGGSHFRIGANSDGGSQLEGRNLNFESFTEDQSEGSVGYVWNGEKTAQQWEQLQPLY